LLQKGSESLRRYKYDYIFSEYENTTLIANSIKGIISNQINNDKNICFLTFGEEKLGKQRINLGKTRFLFGNNLRITNDSFFKYMYDNIEKQLNQEYAYDNILIDIVKITGERFVLDYVHIIKLEKCYT
jgi:hypothetical protein